MNLIIGLGNILLTDEGIGIHVLRELKEETGYIIPNLLIWGLLLWIWNILFGMIQRKWLSSTV